MKQISAERYIEKVNEIYAAQPEYRTGGDGSDGTCDCIGMCRGALKRGGAGGVTGMGGTNYAARHTLKNLHKITSSAELKPGDVVLKTRDKDDKNMPLPDQYRKGGNDYSGTWGETNFTHIGTVTQNNPLRIIHMTSPTAKIDTSLGRWEYAGELPWIDYEKQEEPDTPAEWVTVRSEDGNPVKMRAKPSTSCRTWWKVPSGSQVVLMEYGEEWSSIIWAGQSGYMMTKFLTAEKPPENLVTVIINGLTRQQAEEITGKYGGEIVAG